LRANECRRPTYLLHRGQIAAADALRCVPS
jgi:hypothetical protein